MSVLEFIIYIFGLESFSLPIFFSIYSMFILLIVFLLLLIVIYFNEDLRSSVKIKHFDDSDITLKQEYLDTLEKYQNLLSEKKIEIEKLEGIKITLEAQLQLLSEKSQHPFFFKFVISNFNSILTFIIFILVWVLLNKFINHDLSVFLDGNLKSNELVQKNILDSTSKLIQLFTETLQKAGDDNTVSLLDSISKGFFDNSNASNTFLVDQLAILMRSLSDSDSQALVEIINEFQIVAIKIANIDSQLSLLYPLLDTLVSQLVTSGLLDPLTSQMMNPSAFG